MEQENVLHNILCVNNCGNKIQEVLCKLIMVRDLSTITAGVKGGGGKYFGKPGGGKIF